MTGGPDISDGDADDILAAEFALGLLAGEDRATAERRIGDDSAFAEKVAFWQERLAGMADGIPPVEAPAHIRAALEEQLFGDTREARAPGFFDRLGFWRATAVAALAALVAVLAAIVFVPPPPDESGHEYAALLASEESSVRVIALYDTQTLRLRARLESGSADQGRSYELWLIEGGNPPASLGLLGADGTFSLALDESVGSRVGEGATLAVSDEPSGGSPTGSPTGPVVASGRIGAL